MMNFISPLTFYFDELCSERIRVRSRILARLMLYFFQDGQAGFLPGQAQAKLNKSNDARFIKIQLLYRLEFYLFNRYPFNFPARIVRRKILIIGPKRKKVSVKRT